MNMRYFSTVAAAALIALSGSAFAGSTTLSVTPGSGAALRMGTDGSSNLFSNGAICDGAACAVLAAVKAASTAPAATDPALVVTISPNSANSASLSKGPIASAPAVTASAYTANMALGALQTVSVFRTTTQPSGVLNSFSMYSKGGLTASEAIYAFTKSPASTCTDHTAFALSSTDLPYLIPGFPITLTPSALAGTTQTTAASTGMNITISNQDSSATTNIYVCAVTLGTPTPASTSDVGFGFTMLQD